MLPMKRFLRDILILVSFCSAFYFLTLFAGGGDVDFNESSNFSKDRKVADARYKENDWESAVAHYEQLIEDDPFNELAYARRAKADLILTEQMYRQYQRDEKKLKDDPEQLHKEQAELKAAVARSIKFHLQLVELPRYRARAFRELMSLYCVQGDSNMGIIMFEALATCSGKSEVRPMWNDPRLQPLMSDKRFAEYSSAERVAREYMIRW